MNVIKQYRYVRPLNVDIYDDKLWVTLEDERIISTPLTWYLWLISATRDEQQHIELLPDGLYWTDLDEGLEIEGMLRGIRPIYPQTAP
ncbi:MAG: DUF2442 domain-containing protein [Aggregatilineales bacterium]